MLMLVMTGSELSYSKYWTFEQALAWVLYRQEDIVSYVGPRSSGRLSLLAMYPANFSPALNRIGESEDLLAALRHGGLTASGCNEANAGARKDIPSQDWLKLRLYGGKVFRISDEGTGTLYPWRDIILESGEVKKRFRSQSEVSGRTKYDWDAIHELYEETRRQYPDFSQNELITELQGIFQDRFNREPPSRSTIQAKMKRWI